MSQKLIIWILGAVIVAVGVGIYSSSSSKSKAEMAKNDVIMQKEDSVMKEGEGEQGTISGIPASSENTKKVENKNMTQNETQKNSIKSEDSKSVTSNSTLVEKSKKYKLAPELSTIDGYVNTNGLPVTLSQYKGKKVVLLNIWTYTCINCQRTLPYLNSWYTKYEDKGLVIIGLHTPEFSYERVQKNVEDAVKKFDIKYPVALDNDYSTWKAYGNQYWPRKYLIDKDGYIVYDHIGEGAYVETEAAIQKALSELTN